MRNRLARHLVGDRARPGLSPHLLHPFGDGLQLPGVAQVLVYGAQKFAVRVQVDPVAAASRNISLEDIRSVVSKTNSNTPVGTLNGPGASLIGDGLASCAMRFDRQGDERSRSIILATDNEVNGDSIVTLEEASNYAASAGVRVFALNPVQGVDTDISAELATAAEATGGKAYGLRDTTTVSDIIKDVQEQEATELRGQAQVVWTDNPNPWIAVLLVAALGFVVLLWRVRL